MKKEEKKIKAHFKEHAFQLITGFVTGGLGAIVSLYWPQTSTVPCLVVAVVSFLHFFLLGIISSEVVVLVTERSVLQQVEKSLDLIRQENALLPGVSKSVHTVIVRYSQRFWGDIATKDQKVLVIDYLRLLEESLEVASKKIFATSLINPGTWLSDKLYTNYLRKQIDRKDTIFDLIIQRVFILNADEFYNDAQCEEVVKMHLESGIQIGFCDKIALRREDLLDLVIFETNGDSWVVEGGSLPSDIQSSNDKELVSLRFHFADYSLQQLFMHWKRDIDTHSTYFNDMNEFLTKKQELFCG